MIVLFTLYVFMGGDFGGWMLFCRKTLVVTFFQNDADGVITVIPVIHGPFAGIVESFVTSPGGKAQYSLAGFIGLFGMLAAINDAFDIVPAGLSDLFALLDELVRIPVGLIAVFAGQVIFHGGVLIGPSVPVMHSDTIVAVIHFHQRLAVEQGHLFADLLVRHTVIMFVLAQKNKIVLHHSHYLPVFDLIAAKRQGLK